MALGRPPLGKRALLAATLGAIYGLLLLPRPDTLLGIDMLGVAWFMLSVGLLFLTPLAYHAFTLFGMLWVVWKGIQQVQDPAPWWSFAIDLAFPLVAVALLMTSRYLQRSRELLEARSSAPASPPPGE